MINNKKILIVGWPGQDAYFLKSQLEAGFNKCYLLARDYWADFNNNKFTYESVIELKATLLTERFDIVFFAQASHGGINHRSKSSNSGDTVRSNTLLVAEILDIYASKTILQPDTIVYFSSKLCLEKPISESRGLKLVKRLDLEENSAYTASKICSEILLKEFSAHANSSVIILHMFNHESARRSTKFFIPRLMNWLYGSREEECLPTSKAKLYPFNPANLIDIGYAKEFIEIVLQIADSNLRDKFQLIQLGTAKLVALSDLLEGLCSFSDKGTLSTFKQLIDYTCTPAPNHNAADLSILTKQLKIKPPQIYGNILGKTLTQDFIRNQGNELF